MEDFSKNYMGQYTYIGIKNKLLLMVNPDLHEDGDIELIINIDGFKPFKGSKCKIWPSLCKIFNKLNLYPLFPAAIYSGISHPKDIYKYSKILIEELNLLSKEGIVIKGKKFNVFF